MQVTYYLKETEIGPAFLESLKAAFRGQTVRISIETETNSPAEALAEKITAGLNADHAYRLPYETIAKLADSLEADEPVDAVALVTDHRNGK